MLCYLLTVLVAYGLHEWAERQFKPMDTMNKVMGSLTWPFVLLTLGIGMLITFISAYREGVNEQEINDYCSKHVPAHSDTGARCAFIICLVAMLWWAI